MYMYMDYQKKILNYKREFENIKIIHYNLEDFYFFLNKMKCIKYC